MIVVIVTNSLILFDYLLQNEILFFKKRLKDVICITGRKRSRRLKHCKKHHSERVNLIKVQSFRLAFYTYATTGCASLTRGYENIVFQTNT